MTIIYSFNKQPADNFRPYLTSFQGNAFTDYINAVFVDGYTKPRGENCNHIKHIKFIISFQQSISSPSGHLKP